MKRRVILGCLLLASAAAQTGVSDDRVRLPDGPGSLGGVGEHVGLDANMGTMAWSLPIEVPPGFAGVTPALALTYDSGAGSGPVGRWSDWTVIEGAPVSAAELPLSSLEDLDGDGLADLVVVSGAEVRYALNRNGTSFFAVARLTSDAVDGDIRRTPTAARSSVDASRLVAIPGVVESVTYDERGLATGRRHADGSETGWTYDDRLRRAALRTTLAGTTVQAYAYDRNRASRLVRVRDGGDARWPGGAADLTLDAWYRATRVAYAEGAKDFAFDAIDNLTSKDGITLTYGEGAGPNAVTSAGSSGRARRGSPAAPTSSVSRRSRKAA